MKKENRCKFFLILFIIAFTGCEMFEPHVYSGKVRGEKEINARNRSIIEERCNSSREQIKFAVISDTQGWYDHLEDCVKSLNGRSDIDFVLHLGDITDYGTTPEFTLQRDILEELSHPYLTIIGNHDCLGNGEEIYEKIFGPLNYTFMAGDVRFVMLNTNALEFDYSESVPDFIYLESLLSNIPLANKRTIVAMHAAPHTEQLVDNLSRAFHEYIKKFPGLMFCLAGHVHDFGERDIFRDGIIYYECTCIKKRGYYIFTITSDGYDKEIVEF